MASELKDAKAWFGYLLANSEKATLTERIWFSKNCEHPEMWIKVLILNKKIDLKLEDYLKICQTVENNDELLKLIDKRFGL